MSERWQTDQLGKYCYVKARIGWRGLAASEYTESGPFLIAGKHIESGRIDWNAADHISEFRYHESSEIALVKGDVILSKDGTIGRVARIDSLPGKATINGTMMLIRPIREIDYRFLYHALNGAEFKKLIDDKVSGSSIPHIFQRDMVTLPLSFPRIAHQVKLAEILDTLDTAIHETEAIIAKLKAIKQGLLHDLMTRGIDANGELRPPQTEAPHLYKESPVGPIPREWNLGPLQTWLVGRPRNGYSPQEASEWTGVQMLGLGCLTTEGFEPVQLKPAPRGDRRLATAMLSDGDLLMSRSNTRDLVGLAGVYRDVGSPCSYPDLMMRLRPSPETNGEFLQFVLRSPRLRRQIQAYAVGTSGSMVKVSGKIVSDLMTAMPKMGEQEHILNCLAAGESRLRTTVKELSVLHELKSGLMNDLLTGRIRVTPLLSHQTT